MQLCLQNVHRFLISHLEIEKIKRCLSEKLRIHLYQPDMRYDHWRPSDHSFFIESDSASLFMLGSHQVL